MSTQVALPFDEPTSVVERQFCEWIETEDGRALKADILSRVRRLQARAWMHYSIDALFHAARFDWSLKMGPGVEGYRVNNNFTSHMARLLMRENPELEGFFETRELRGRAWRVKQ